MINTLGPTLNSPVKILLIQKLYNCNFPKLHLPHQTDRQTDRQESRNPRCDEGFKVCSVSNRFSATLMDNPAGATAARRDGGAGGSAAAWTESLCSSLHHPK